MKKLFKKICTFVLTLTLCLSFCTIGVSASQDPYTLYLKTDGLHKGEDGELLVSGEWDEFYTAGSYTYNDNTKTLTLTGMRFTSSAEIAMNLSAVPQLETVLVGDSVITSTNSVEETDSYGIYADNITISGEGSLNATAVGGTQMFYSYGIYGISGITINGGSIYATGGQGGSVSSGIISPNSITINGGNITATSGRSTNSYAIYSLYGTFTINDGIVNTYGGTGINGNSFGICCFGNVIINGGTLTSTAATAPNSSGIEANITINDGTVIATGGTSRTNTSYGFGGNSNININGGTVISMGETGAFYSLPSIDTEYSYKWRSADDAEYTEYNNSDETTSFNYGTTYRELYAEIVQVEAGVPEPVTVTFLSHDGTTLSTQTVDYGSTATAPTAPTRDGYTFSGWSADFSNVTSDLTVTAQYTENQPLLPANNPVASVSLTSSYLSLTTGDTAHLNAAITPSNATNQSVAWYSDNPYVASVQNGLVTAVSTGTAMITVTTAEGGHTAYCNVTVSNPTPSPSPSQPSNPPSYPSYTPPSTSDTEVDDDNSGGSSNDDSRIKENDNNGQNITGNVDRDNITATVTANEDGEVAATVDIDGEILETNSITAAQAIADGTAREVISRGTSVAVVTQDNTVIAGVNSNGTVNSQATRNAVKTAVESDPDSDSVTIQIGAETIGLSATAVKNIVKEADGRDVIMEIPTVKDGEVVGTIAVTLDENSGQILTGINFDTERAAERAEYMAEKYGKEIIGAFETSQKGGFGDNPVEISVSTSTVSADLKDGDIVYGIIYDTKTGKAYQVTATVIDGQIVMKTKRSGIVMFSTESFV
jgi:uncharacterized repeat protein (TIGR02543 family)